MVSCQQCERYLPLFLDHELELTESLDVQEHLEACESCTARAKAERSLRAFISQHAATPPLPEAIQQQMILRAMQPERRPLRWGFLPPSIRLRDFSIGLATAAVCGLLTVGTFAYLSSPNDIVQKFMDETALAYGTYTGQSMPMEVDSADDSTLTQWFATRMGHYVKIPWITDAATRLQGGRLCRLFDRKSAALLYQRHGVSILLFAFRGDQLALPTKNIVRTNGGAFYVRTVSGHPVAVWQRGGIVYSMVGDLAHEDLLQVASTVSYR